MTDKNSKERFSNRVESYVKARPRYPREVVDLLKQRIDLSPRTVIADVGSGTGISAELFLEAGCEVFAVEPNQAMQEAAEKQLSRFEKFHSVNGSAEATTLPDHSVDLVIAAQAFHWFDAAKFRVECARILHPLGNVLLMWNTRLEDCDAFAVDYEKLLAEFATDYKSVNHRNISESQIAQFFGGDYESIKLANAQSFDFDGLEGRFMSSSYVPAEGDPRQQPMLEALRGIFDLHQANGQVEMKYETELFLGPLR